MPCKVTGLLAEFQEGIGRLYYGRFESGLGVGDFKHHWIRPLAIVVEALRVHGADVQAWRVLLPGGLGYNIGPVFKTRSFWPNTLISVLAVARIECNVTSRHSPYFQRSPPTVA